jgi:hypothetical protein
MKRSSPRFFFLPYRLVYRFTDDQREKWNGCSSNVARVRLVTYLVKVQSETFRACSSTSGLNFWHRSFTFNSNKSTTWCNSFSVYYPDVCLQLNMFQAFSCPSSGAQWLQWQPLVLPSYRGDSRAVFVVGPAGLTTNIARLSSLYKGKTRGCHCSHWAPDDGRENARKHVEL